LVLEIGIGYESYLGGFCEHQKIAGYPVSLQKSQLDLTGVPLLFQCTTLRGHPVMVRRLISCLNKNNFKTMIDRRILLEPFKLVGIVQMTWSTLCIAFTNLWKSYNRLSI
jgi:hypothetical protein